MNTPVQNGQLPEGFCPPDFQTMLNGFSAAQFVALPSITGLSVSSTPPADHTVAWLQLDSFGRPVRVYFFAQGAWLSQHPLPPGFTMIWTQALPDFTTFDGGDNHATPYSSLSGQMWQVASTTLDGTGTALFNGRAPMGVGTFPSGATLALGAQVGEDVHKLVTQEMFPHLHGEQIAVNLAVPNGGVVRPDGSGAFVGSISNGGTEIQSRPFGGDPASGNPPTAALPHNTLPPITGVYFLQRTNRLFYVVNP